MSFCKFSTEYIASNKTEVDNIFINDFLPFAPENAVKVYLYGLYLCGCSNSLSNTLEMVSKQLNLDAEEVIDCFMYWQEQGLVKVLSTQPIEVRYIPLKDILNGTKLYKPDKYEVFNVQAQELFEGARQITKNEYYEYYDFLERTKMSQEALIMIMKYCIDCKKPNVGYSYILTVAKNWANEGVLTAEDAENRIFSFEELSKDIGILAETMGIKRKTTIEEKNLFKKWTDDLGYSFDVLSHIAKKLVKKGKPNFEKLDALVMKYYSLGLYSILEIEESERTKAEYYELAKQVNKEIGVYYENLETVVENYITKWKQLGFTNEAILEIASYCRKTTIRTLEGLNDKIQKFYRLGLLTCDALHSHLESVLKTDKQIQKILDNLGIIRKVNYIDREFFKTWTEIWQMPEDLIDYASALSSQKVQPMQYMNSILANWHQKNVKTLKEAKENSSLPVQQASKNPIEGRSYKKEELDALIQSIDEVEI